MKIKEYISSSLFNSNNVMRYRNFEKWAEQLSSENIIFLQIDSIQGEIIEQVLSQYKNKIIVNVHVDFDFPPPKLPFTFRNFQDKEEYEDLSYYDKINNNVIKLLEDNNLYVYSFSVSVLHPRITFLPIGVFSNFNHFHLKHNTKTQLCYANFGIGNEENCWYGYPRQEAFEIIKTKPFITVENICSQQTKIFTKTLHMKTKNGIKKQIINCGSIGGRDVTNIDNFYNQISKSKFSICPRGSGIDTYRLWDCIVLGCIPIVEKYDSHEQFKDLPIYFIDSIQDLDQLTEEVLENIYNEYQEREFNYEKLLIDNWKQKILSHKIVSKN